MEKKTVDFFISHTYCTYILDKAKKHTQKKTENQPQQTKSQFRWNIYLYVNNDHNNIIKFIYILYSRSNFPNVTIISWIVRWKGVRPRPRPRPSEWNNQQQQANKQKNNNWTKTLSSRHDNMILKCENDSFTWNLVQEAHNRDRRRKKK